MGTNGTSPDLLAARFARIKRDDEGKPRKWKRKTKTERLVGTAEAAAILEVERPRIGRWIQKGIMPQPVCWLAAGPLWWEKDIKSMEKDVAARRR